ncbi:hypothetical protein CDL12_14969 [Handroanthus impetiginosus]|uniref:Protein FAR1-RELATED SEQUENCE n=1 Tax=Handroanthus impetiginosus TaxID=429701 RepID=A0A2G9H4G6_9LAMI|nr:hypothetical protein CDL12_14969 [Handroanthus impetiginosus]
MKLDRTFLGLELDIDNRFFSGTLLAIRTGSSAPKSYSISCCTVGITPRVKLTEKESSTLTILHNGNTGIAQGKTWRRKRLTKREEKLIRTLQEMDINNCDNFTPRRKLEFISNDAIKEKHDHLDDSKSPIIESHSAILEEKIPKIGMEFDSEKAAYKFYNEYAREAGFSIRKHTVHKDITGKIIDRSFCCACQGHRQKDKRDVNIKSHRPETRKGCPAMMSINGRYIGKYKVVNFVAKHTGHNLVSPSKTHLLRSLRNINVAQTSQADDIDSSGIAPKAGFALMAKQRTVEMKIGDTGGVLEYLQQRQLDDPNFFYAIQIDEDDLIANILWVDAQMMADYAHFGDVVCFDTTYRKNKEGRPFALFDGVNHHKQTIVFGAALIYDETTSTFIWLFDTFARAMSGKQPQTILTDQDAAMAKALAIKWPKTYHRLCIWHIYQNAAMHLSHVFTHFVSFSKDFSSCIYDYEEEEEFLNAWQEMLEKYGLQSNKWLERMFKIREKWALVYGRQIFCADLTTTQRSESMKSVLKRYHNLLQFFNHIDRLIDDRRYEELKADLRTCHSTPVSSFPVEILKHAASIYTHEVFELFQDEVRKTYDSTVELYDQSGEILEYKVTPYKRHYQHRVLFEPSQGKVSCSCKKFEFAGILCLHALKVLSLKNIVKIPELYIKKRWTKKAKTNVVKIQSSGLLAELVGPMNEKEEKKMIGI